MLSCFYDTRRNVNATRCKGVARPTCLMHPTTSLCTTTTSRVKGCVLEGGLSGVSGPIGPGLSRIVDMNFGEHPFPRCWLNKPPADVPEPSGWQTPILCCSSWLWTCSPASSGHSTAGETGSPPRLYSPQRPSRPSSVPCALATGDLLGRTLLAEVSPVR